MVFNLTTRIPDKETFSLSNLLFYKPPSIYNVTEKRCRFVKVVLCDDNLAELNELKTKTDRYLTVIFKDDYALLSYDSSVQLEFDLQDIAYADLYILDIDMPDPNGISLAKQILHLNPFAIIYFYTSHSEYATEGYRLDVKRYIVKGCNDELFEEAIRYACDSYSQRKKDHILLPFDRDHVNIPISEIMYITRINRKVLVHTHSYGIVQTNLSLSQLRELLDPRQFVFIDRGIILDLEYVLRTDHNKITLFNQESFYISQKRVTDVKQAIALYWGGKK